MLQDAHNPPPASIYALLCFVWAIDFGGACALLAWGIILYRYWGEVQDSPISTYMFTVAVCTDLVGSRVLDRVGRSDQVAPMLGWRCVGQQRLRRAHISMTRPCPA